MENAQIKTGIVAMVDVLGTRSKTTRECVELTEHMTKLVDSLKNYANSLKQSALIGNMKDMEIEMRWFQDTIILTCELGKEHIDNIPAQPLGFMRALIPMALREMIPLRGAVSLGDYVISPNSVLGRALFEASKYYEKYNWLGVVVTPKLANAITSTLSRNRIDSQTAATFCVQYNAPIKNKNIYPVIEHSKSWVLSWPVDQISLFWSNAKTLHSVDAREMLFDRLNLVSGQPRHNDKRINTLKFYDWYYEQYGRRIQDEFIKYPGKMIG